MAAGHRAVYNLVSRGGASPAASTRAVGAAGEWRVFLHTSRVQRCARAGRLVVVAEDMVGRLARLRTVCMKALGSLRRHTRTLVRGRPDAPLPFSRFRLFSSFSYGCTVQSEVCKIYR